MGLLWLRAAAQVYTYSCNTIELRINFQKNLKSRGVKLGWGLDACARWRTVTITVTIKYNWVVIFKRIPELEELNWVGA